MVRTEEQIEQSKQKRRDYMRDYKRKQYEQDREQTNINQKLYYYQKKFPHICFENIKPLNVMQAEFSKVQIDLQKIKDEHPNVLKEYLTDYLKTL
jgi:predicted metal-dependent hydrolase